MSHDINDTGYDADDAMVCPWCGEVGGRLCLTKCVALETRRVAIAMAALLADPDNRVVDPIRYLKRQTRALNTLARFVEARAAEAGPSWLVRIGDLVRRRSRPEEPLRVIDLALSGEPQQALCVPGDRWIPLDVLERADPPSNDERPEGG